MFRMLPLLLFVFVMASWAQADCFPGQSSIGLVDIFHVPDYSQCTVEELGACETATKMYLEQNAASLTTDTGDHDAHLAMATLFAYVANARASLNAVHIEQQRRR